MVALSAELMDHQLVVVLMELLVHHMELVWMLMGSLVHQILVVGLLLDQIKEFVLLLAGHLVAEEAMQVEVVEVLLE